MDSLKALYNKYYKSKDIIIFIFLLIIAGFCSIYLGMERQWDTLNYHIYNPYAFLTGRMNIDIMPAGIQSYFNPLLDIPYYLLIKYNNNHPCINTFLMGFDFALFIFMIYKISSLIFKNYYKNFIVIFCIICASATYIVYRHIGFLSHDLFLNALGLVGVYYLLKALDKEHFKLKYIIIAGLSTGLACGLKYYASVFALPTVLTALIFIKNFKKPKSALIALLSSSVIGFLITGGFWVYKLYITFGNPFMPYFNSIFLNPNINIDNIYRLDFPNYDIRYKLFYPFTAKWGIWMNMLYFTFIANFLLFKFFDKNDFESRYKIKNIHINFLICFLFIAYLYWVNYLAVARYFIFAAGLSSLILFALALKFLHILFAKSKYVPSLNVINIIAIVVITSGIIIGNLYEKKKRVYRINPLFMHTTLSIDNTRILIPDNAIVLNLHGTGFIIPFLNPNAKYIHLNSKVFTRIDSNLFTQQKLNEITKLIKNNKDSVYFISKYRYRHRYNNIERYQITNIKKLIKMNKQMPQETLISEYRASLYELDKLGIDMHPEYCNRIFVNYFRYPFYLCKMRLKNE